MLRSAHLGLDARATSALLAGDALDGATELALEECGLGKSVPALGRAIAARASLDRLGLVRCKLNARGLEALAEALPAGQLRALDLRGNPIGDDGARILASAPAFAALQEIDLVYTRIKLDGLRALTEGLPRLERWTSGADKIGFEGARILANSNWRLTHLRASRQNLGSAGVEAIAAGGPETLRVLVLMEVGVGRAACKAIAASPRLARLEELRFCYDAVDDRAIEALASSPSLAGLRRFLASSCRIGVEGVAAIASSPHWTRLETLDLGANPRIGVKGARKLAHGSSLRSLRSLCVSSMTLGVDGVACLLEGEWPALESLELSWTDLGDDGLAVLRDWPGLARLKHLGLGTNSISDEALARFADCPSVAGLERVSLFQNPCAARALEIAESSRFLRPSALMTTLQTTS